MREQSLVGACLCGRVEFEASFPSLFCVHCHCEFCRRAHASAFVTWVGIAQEQFKLKKGESLLRWFKSSEQSERGFCTQCGTTLFYRSQICPGEIHIALGAVKTPIDREPQAHVFADQHVSWFQIDDQLPQVPTNSSSLEKFQVIPAKTL